MLCKPALLVLLPVVALAGLFIEPSASCAFDSPSAQEEHDENSWFHLFPSKRPAYVGIHGGTAPVTLVRGEDGTVYAVTGQTGNDFLYALRNSSDASTPPLPNKEQNSTSANGAPEEIEPLAQAKENTIDPTQEQIQLEADRVFPYELFVAQTEEHALEVYSLWADSDHWQTMLARTVAVAEHLEKHESDSIDEKPEDYPSVVFASSTVAGRLVASEQNAVPFGLSSQDSPSPYLITADPAPVTAVVQAIQFEPLVLKDYRTILMGNI